MPYLNVRVSTPESSKPAEKIVAVLMRHTSEVLGKKPDVTLMALESWQRSREKPCTTRPPINAPLRSLEHRLLQSVLADRVSYSMYSVSGLKTMIRSAGHPGTAVV